MKLLLNAALLEVWACSLTQWFGAHPTDIQRIRTSVQTNSRGQAVRSFLSLSVSDASTGRLLWTADTPPGFNTLVADHYLIGIEAGRVLAIDIDDALSVPINPGNAQLKRPVKFQPFAVPFVGFTRSVAPLSIRVVAVPGTNRFLIHEPTRTEATIHAFEIEGRTIRHLTSWDCDTLPPHALPNGQINSVKPDGSAMEARSPTDFEVIRTMPMPAWLTSWGSLKLHNYMYSFGSSKSPTVQVGLLEDLEPIPNLNIALGRYPEDEMVEDRRYHILSDDALWACPRLLVYDALDRKVAFDSGPVNGYSAAKIIDGHLRLSQNKLGQTTQVIDLSTGKLVRTERPYLWIMVSMPLLLLASLIWLCNWIKRVHGPRWTWPVNILFLTALFTTPLLIRTARRPLILLGIFPSANYCLAAVEAACFCLAIYAVFGRGRPLLRIVPILTCMSVLFALGQHFKMIEFSAGTLPGRTELSFRIWITFVVISVGILCAMRYLGWKLNRESPAEQPLPSDSSRVHLADLFALTAIVAFTISIMGPKLDLLVSPNDQVTVAAKSLWLAGMGVMGMFALAPRPTAYRMAAVTLSLLALVDIVLRVSVPTLWNPVLYQDYGRGALSQFPVLGNVRVLFHPARSRRGDEFKYLPRVNTGG